MNTANAEHPAHAARTRPASAAARAVAACERFTSSRPRCLAVAFAFTAVVYVVALLGYAPHGLNDDWSIANALSGNWHDPQGLCLFLNVVLCRLVFFLNGVFPRFLWFFVLECVTAYASYLALVYLALSRARFPLAFLLVAGLTLFMVPGCTIQPNFTYVAGFALCAGGMCLLASLASERHSPLLVVAGIAFFAIGIMWRANLLLPCIPVFGVAALLVVFGSGLSGRGGAVRRAVRIWPFAVVLVVAGGLVVVDGAAWGQEPWADWVQFNDARSLFSDYPHRPYEEAADDLLAIGVSETDYDLVRNWITEDPDFFTPERMEQIAKASTVNILEPPRVLKNVARFFYRTVKDYRLFALLAALAIVVGLTLRGPCRRAAFAVLGVAAAVGAALLVLGRLPDRVEYPLWMFALAAACALAPAGGVRPDDGEEARDALHAAQPAWSARYAVASLAPLAAPVVACALVLSSAAAHLCPERLQAAFDAQSFAPESPLLSYMEEHPDTVFVMNAGSTFDLVYANMMVVPNSAFVNEHTVSIGGWGARAPYASARNARAGMANPLRGLAENDSAVYVSASESSPQLLRSYLREHYFPQADYELVATVGSFSGKAEYYLFKFSAG